MPKFKENIGFKNSKPATVFSLLEARRLFLGLVWFYSISTLECYLKSNLVIYIFLYSQLNGFKFCYLLFAHS